ncbi:uncharacterized protein LOC129616537 [Condylostylus longicornis]|uniref:uncharacterized protein LOC129616537 n=1 Tax=Condylostylus longicornis TaxID=2530218 RepID=UPI00244DE54A|nr:uncharacterized protein LOC129616537 [Condylostylus longicornis]
MIFITIFLIILIIILKKLNKNYNLLAGCRRIKNVDGTPLYGVIPSLTIFGNNFDLISLDEEKLFKMARNDAKNAKRSYFKFLVGNPFYEIITPEESELILNNTVVITKGLLYNFLHPHLGTGLLTSTHQKWHTRRKLLTPSFHFNILQKFLETFKDESFKFIANIKDESSDIVNLSDVIPKFTLNTVCETALGVNLDDIGKSKEYRENISASEQLFIKRVFNPVKHFDCLYKMFEEHEPFQRIVNELHNFSSTIIKLRRNIFQNKDVTQDSLKPSSNSDDDIYFFKKERRAMLDTLLEAEEKNLIDHQGICEEVDTFMFEGFDTTSAGLMFAILCLGTYQEIQQKCYEEILQLPDDFSKLTITDLNNLQYLDCVIKESLRLYPPVPMIARKTDEEIQIGNYILPKGCNIHIHIFEVHRNPHHFPNPGVFDPDRFLPENSIKRHPYAYIPFSAGIRNCIGQKFALLEIKVLIASLLKNYKIYPKTRIEDIVFQAGLILRSKYPLKVRLEPRLLRMIFITIFLIILIIILKKLNKNYNLLAGCRRIKNVDGTPLYGVFPSSTIFGNNFDIISLDEEKLFKMTRNDAKNAKRSYFKYVVATPVYEIITPEDVELVLNNTAVITKGLGYEFLQPHLGTGLLTSTNQKWHARRKLLTPSFHFNILQKFLETFKDESFKFINNIKNQPDDIVNLFDVIQKFTLNTVCETALGVNLDDIGKSEEYRKNISASERFFMKRIFNPIKQFDVLYKMFEEYEAYQKVVNELHKFSSTIIKLRRNIFQNKDKDDIQDSKKPLSNSEDDIYFFKKERRAMLDTLLEAEEKNLIDHQGICEEVDTFMFEGFDTTSAGLMFTILCLATYQEIQEKCYEDILQLPDDFSELTIANLNNLQYLDCVIKESLRLYPPVPLIARKTEEEVVIGNYILPKGCNINIHIFDIHRDSYHFPNPEVFDPNRFLPENSIKRHPYAYIPFSAGVRNCIGQKFALLEIKVLIASLLKNYKIYPKTKLENIVFQTGLILRSKYPVEIRLEPRHH